MANANWELQKSLYGVLVGDSTLTMLLSGPKIYDDVPQGTSFPYVTIGESTVRDWSTGSDDGLEHILTLHVWSRSRGRKQVHEIMDAMADKLHDADLPVAGHRLVNFRHELSEARRENDGETYHGIVRYRAVTEPVI